MTPCFAYLRCSGKGQVDGDTWDRQQFAVAQFAQHHGYEIMRVFREEAVPGKTELDGRPAYQEMLEQCRLLNVKVILVEALDRFAREFRIQELFLTELCKSKLTLIAANTGENVTEAFMGDPMRRALVQIQGIFAELDKNLIVAKLSKARERIRTERKELCEGQPPYGWAKVSPKGEPTRLVPVPDEQDTIQRIQRLHKLLKNCTQIAYDLNTFGVRTRSGKLWTGTQVKRILARPALPHDSTQNNSQQVN